MVAALCGSPAAAITADRRKQTAMRQPFLNGNCLYHCNSIFSRWRNNSGFAGPGAAYLHHRQHPGGDFPRGTAHSVSKLSPKPVPLHVQGTSGRAQKGCVHQWHTEKITRIEKKKKKRNKKHPWRCSFKCGFHLRASNPWGEFERQGLTGGKWLHLCKHRAHQGNLFEFLQG